MIRRRRYWSSREHRLALLLWDEKEQCSLAWNSNSELATSLAIASTELAKRLVGGLHLAPAVAAEV